MLRQMTFEDLNSATFSQGSESGHMLCVWPDGQITNRYGQEVAHASLSARQAKALGLMTSGTYGQPSTGSSNSANLQASSVNKLQIKLQTLGSTLYTLTWKPWITPSGVARFRLRASARRTSETELTGWATPRTSTHSGNPARSNNNKSRLEDQVFLAGWQTPRAKTRRSGAALLRTSGTDCRCKHNKLQKRDERLLEKSRLGFLPRRKMAPS